ncbi:NADH-quinone oxidoreductase subunit K [Alphaproteobacteria bacterium]|nr:NADH-quinone oxidoreductase subunit K [Alphaproteobacteria bacterium]
MLPISLGHYIILCIFLLSVGLCGLLINRRETLILLISSEIAFIAGLFLFVVFSRYQQNLKGQAFALIIFGAMIAKLVISIGIVLTLYRKKQLSFEGLEKRDDFS